MDNFLKRFIKFVLIGGFVLVALWVGWWYLRWSTGMAVFEAARDHLRDSLGLSSAVAAVIASSAGIAAAFLMTVLVINAKFILAAVVAIMVLGLPLALLNDTLSADQCFNRQTGKPLCEVWETPTGGYAVRRKDGAYPPSSWQLFRDATRADARAYLTSSAGVAGPLDATARVPHPIALASCIPAPTFFDAAGQAVVYWSRDDDLIELWDRRGPHPTTGNLLQPMTPKVAKEVCAKLAEAKLQLEAKLAQDQAAVAEHQTAEQEAQQIAQRLQEEETQHRVDQQRLEEERRISAEREAVERSNQEAAQRQLQSLEESRAPQFQQQNANNHEATLAIMSVNNRDCRGADVYLDGQIKMTVAPATALSLEISRGQHNLRFCEAGTSECGQDLPMNIVQNGFINYMSSKPGCEVFPPRFAPQWINPRFPVPTALVGNRSRYEHRNDAFLFRMPRR